jgi:predicted RNA-binding protein Jag
METYEFEGKNTEEAIQNAARELNLPVEELHIDVIEPGSAGIFGLVGGRKAKIKVTLKTSSKLQEEEEEQEPIETKEEPQDDDVNFADSGSNPLHLHAYRQAAGPQRPSVWMRSAPS